MGSVHFDRVRYAVVEARYSSTELERLVIAYQQEKTLRALIAPHRIVSIGFASEHEAAEMLNLSKTPQGRLRRWLRPLEAGLSTTAGIGSAIASLFAREQSALVVDGGYQERLDRTPSIAATSCR
jgi:hypothetical protein